MLARLSSHESVFFSRQILNVIEYMTLKVLGQCACMGTWVSVLKFWNPKHSHGPKSGEQGGWGTTSNRYAIAIVGFFYSGRASERFVLLLYSFQSSRLGLFLWNTKKKLWTSSSQATALLRRAYLEHWIMAGTPISRHFWTKGSGPATHVNWRSRKVVKRTMHYKR